MTHILLLGKNGRLGCVLADHLYRLGNVIAIDRTTCDIIDFNALHNLIDRTAPDIIVNATAYTDVEQAEKDPSLAYPINTETVGVLAELANRCGALLVHYSTDYVFDGKKTTPYSETDKANPLSVYGKSKLAGENLLTKYTNRYLIFRMGWLFGIKGQSFPKSVLRAAYSNSILRVVEDEYGIPTAMEDVAVGTVKVLMQYIQTKDKLIFPYGLYHLSSTGKTSRYHYVQTILDIAKLHDAGRYSNAKLYPTKSQEQIGCAIRPENVQLDATLLNHTFGVSLIPWIESIRQAVPLLLQDILLNS